MTQPRTAKLAYLTQPEPGTVYLNLQFDGAPGITRGVETFERVALTADQLRNMLADGVGMVCPLVQASDEALPLDDLPGASA